MHDTRASDAAMLARIPGLGQLPAREREALLICAPAIAVEEGHAVFRQGESAGCALLLLEGRCRVEVEGDGGNTVVGHVRSGALIGEVGLYCRDTLRSATVIAEQRTRALVIEPGLFRAADARPAVTMIERRSLSELAERVRHSHARLRRAHQPTTPDAGPPARRLGILSRLLERWSRWIEEVLS